MKHIVLIGGWSGISHLIRAFTRVPDWSIHAIVATSDSGGSTGVIRDSYNIPAIGDIVKNLAALGWEQASWMTYRHQDGFLAGHTTGNLWLLGLIEQYGLSDGIKKAHNLLWYTQHEIIPATEDVHDIEVKTKTETIRGEWPIIQCRTLSNNVDDIYLQPKVSAAPRALQALRQADMIIIGPGTLYTSIIASLLPEGMSEKIRNSKAKKIFIANAANFPPGHCDKYTLSTYLAEIHRFGKIWDFTAILAHDGSDVPQKDQIVIDTTEGVTCMNCLDTPESSLGGKYDSIKRNTLRHDGQKVAEWIKKFFD